MLRAGFIGAGGRSRSAHYPSVRRLADQVEMAAVCELDEQRLQQVVDEYGFQRTYTDHRAMLDEVDPDIVYCVMNEKWLLQPALDCIGAGKHLFIEKPVCFTLSDADAMIAAARASGKVAQAGYMKAHDPAFELLEREVPSMGPLRFIQVNHLHTSNTHHLAHFGIKQTGYSLRATYHNM